MAQLLVYYAHPGHRHSEANRAMLDKAREVSGITLVDLYAEYPRFQINIDREQSRLLEHEVILFQFPMFWYSTPALVKEWEDLVLEHGFAYGHDGDRLSGKTMMLAITAGGADEAYSASGYQRYPMRTFLTPLEQTAVLCHMTFATPYVLYGALRAQANDQVEPHAAGYARLLQALRDGRYDFAAAKELDVVTAPDLDQLIEA
ncbi:MAG: NAD(P)H-dependent oxidoreductase [Xanthomonadales bacterium]|nr:NAD(P)H-dependent oxidoreductase [Xanthomonadales bacterium]